jgi:predicted RNase H-like nuclease (RuvC/YqgF family)
VKSYHLAFLGVLSFVLILVLVRAVSAADPHVRGALFGTLKTYRKIQKSKIKEYHRKIIDQRKVKSYHLAFLGVLSFVLILVLVRAVSAAPQRTEFKSFTRFSILFS